ncbi:MAG: sigma factor, partial [Cyclobacteriaceae bacterium]
MDIQDAYDWNQLLKGDKVAFEKLYFRYINALYAYGVRLCRHETLVEDCLQDLFSDLWEKRRKLGPITSVKAYLFVSVKRRILRKLTCEQRRNTEELR